MEHQGLSLNQSQGDLARETSRLQQLTQRLMELVQGGLDLQTAVSLLRSYAGPASQYALRSGNVTMEAAKAYDRVLAESWSMLLSREVSVSNERLWLPARMDGCGAASAQTRVYAAPWAAWSTVAGDLVQHFGVRDIEVLLGNAAPISACIAALHANLVQQGTLPSIAHADPARALSFATSQNVLVSFVHKTNLRALRTAMGDDSAAFFRSASGPGAGAFLDTPLDER